MKVVAVSGFAWEPKGTGRARAFPMLSALVARGHVATLLTVPYDNIGLAGSEFTKDGVTVRGLTLDSQPLRLLTAPWRAVQEIEAMRPDVVHVFKPKGYAGAIASLLLRRGRVPVCLDLDDWEGWGGWNEVKSYPWIVKEYIDRQERSLSARCHAVTAASLVLETRAMQSGQSRDRVFYVPNCRTRAQFDSLGDVAMRNASEAKLKLGLPTDKTVLLFTGFFEPAEDVLFLCRAVEQALVNGATLLLVGEGEELPKVRAYFAARPELDVRFAGELPFADYLDAVAAADIACFPYPDTPVYRAKCSGRIIEYMASGKAVVTTNLGQNPEYIVDGESGLLCAPNDAADFSRQILRLMVDPAFARKLGTASRERIGNRFLWDLTPAETCEAAYERAIDVYTESLPTQKNTRQELMS